MNKLHSEGVSDEIWGALLSAGVFVEGEFTFASGASATLKVDAEKLYSHPRELSVIVGYFAAHQCIQSADVLLYVPEGMRQFVHQLGNEFDKPVVQARRTPNTLSRYSFEFETDADKELAHTAKAPVICEDIVTTLGSVAAIRRLLKPEQQVQSLAILRRGDINPDYQEGLADHYLLEREIPTDKNEFRRIQTKEWT